MAQETLSTDNSQRGDLTMPREERLVALLTAEHAGRLTSSSHSLDGIDEVLLGRGERAGYERVGRRLILRRPDRRMSSEHAKMVRTQNGWVAIDLDSKNGTLVGGVRGTNHPIDDQSLIEVGQTFLLYLRSPKGKCMSTDVEGAALDVPPGMRTLSPTLGDEFSALQRIAPTDIPVLICGQTGVGKELVANAVHAVSRRTGPLIAVNCGALSPTLLEAELFGHRRGAFSGATEERPGLIRAADKGTLFLDEIGELPLAAQVTLLRVLQEREVLPVGGTRAVPVDLRVVAATLRNLSEAVIAGRFREDLLARLDGFEIQLPAAADRREDLGFWIAAALPATAQMTTLAARKVLLGSYPRNIRELHQLLRTAVALAGDRPIDLEHFRSFGGGAAVKELPVADHRSLSDEERALRERIEGLLTTHRGNVSAVAKDLGRAREVVHRWIRRLGIDAGSFRR